MNRRDLIAGAGALALLGRPGAAQAGDPVAQAEAALPARAGVYAIDLATGAEFAHRADERFAMCSTFKAALAGACLARADRGELDLAERLAIREAEILPHSPVTNARRGEALALAELARAAVEYSDNAAANLLIARLGGPQAVTGFFRELGDEVSRLDRMELALNSNREGDPRDTTSPRAMAGVLRRLLVEDALSPASRALLTGWMRDERNARDRIRAAAPAGWQVANKPGTSRSAANDVAVLERPGGGAPVAMAIYLDTAPGTTREAVAAIAGIARAALARIG